MTMFWIAVAVWWLSGTVIMIHEMRHQQDIHVGDVLLAILPGIMGPFILFATLKRNMHTRLLRRYKP